MGTNHQPTDQPTINQPQATSNQSTNQPQATSNQPWCRLVDLCAELGVGYNRARRHVAHLSDDLAQKRLRAEGGKPEWWVRADALDGCTNQPQATTATISKQPATNRQPTDVSVAWLEALDQAKARIAELTGDRDRLRSLLETERVAHQEALRRAEGAELARHAAETRLEALKAAWWRWQVLVQGLTAWQRLLRRWPEQPAELVADRLLAGPTTMGEGHG